MWILVASCLLVLLPAARSELESVKPVSLEACNNYLLEGEKLCDGGGLFSFFFMDTVYCKWLSVETDNKTTNWQLSGESECAQVTNDCKSDIKVEVSTSVSYSAGLKVNPLLVLGAEVNIGGTVGESRSESTSMNCPVHPGYKARIWTDIPKVVKRGEMAYHIRPASLLTLFGYTESCGRGPAEFQMPVKQGYFKHRCESVPIANITERFFDKSPRKLFPGPEYDAVGAVLDTMLKNPPPKGQDIKQHGHANGQHAWSRARCHNIDDRDNANAYHAICFACLKHLKENIWERSENAYGAVWKLESCSMRYEFYEFDDPLLPPS